MTETFERKSLFRISYPLFLYALISVAVTFADTALLSNYSENLAAAVSMANQILGVAYDLSALLSIGALVIISQYLGDSQIEKAKDTARVALLGGAGLGFLIAAVLVAGAPSFVDWVNTPDEIRDDVFVYIYVIAVAMVFNGFIMSAQAALTGFGHTLDILTIGLVSNIVYLAVEYTLIYGAFGFPELGVYGAAWATVIVRGGTIVLLVWMLHWRLGLRFFDIPEGFWPSTLRILKISYPSVAENLAYNIYQLTVAALIAILGVTAVLTRSYALTITQIVMIITLVISHGNQVLVGYDKGAGDNDVAYRRARNTALITGAVSMVGSAVIYLFADTLIGILTDNPEIIASVASILLLQILVSPFNTINLILFNALKACGDVNRPVVASLVLTFGLALPLAYLALAVLDLGVVGLWYVYLFEEAIKALVMFALWRGRKWQDISVIDADNAPAAKPAAVAPPVPARTSRAPKPVR